MSVCAVCAAAGEPTMVTTRTPPRSPRDETLTCAPDSAWMSFSTAPWRPSTLPMADSGTDTCSVVVALSTASGFATDDEDDEDDRPRR